MLSRRLGNMRAVALALRNLAEVVLAQGDEARALALCAEAMALFQGLGDTWGIALSFTVQGDAAQRQGADARAQALYEQGLVLFQQRGDQWNIGATLTKLGVLARRRGDLAGATAVVERGLAIHRARGATIGVADALVALGDIAREQGDAARTDAVSGGPDAVQEQGRRGWRGPVRGGALSVPNLTRRRRPLGRRRARADTYPVMCRPTGAVARGRPSPRRLSGGLRGQRSATSHPASATNRPTWKDHSWTAQGLA